MRIYIIRHFITALPKEETVIGWNLEMGPGDPPKSALTTTNAHLGSRDTS